MYSLALLLPYSLCTSTRLSAKHRLALIRFNIKPSDPSAPTSPVPFFHLLERLKITPREGWRRFDISHGESISDHMYRMSILTMIAPASISSRVNVSHCTRMALIHDMAESLVGDITPVDGVSKGEKSRREAETMQYISSHLLGSVGNGGKEAGETIQAVFQEYEDDVTEEAHFVHDIDKIELILQMVEYEKKHEGRIDLGEFTRVAAKIKLPEVKEWCKQLLLEREVFWTEKGTKGVGGLELGRCIIEGKEIPRELLK